MAEFSQLTQKLIQRYQAWYQSRQPKEGVATLHVDEVASGVASFYEKIRGIIEWREEHLMRRMAIERVLKRRMFLEKSGEKIAEPLVLELIRGGHFQNDFIEESKIIDIKKLIDKYLFILENSPPQNQKTKTDLQNWFLSVAACEIEETLSPAMRENALIEYMTDLMKEKIKLAEKLSQEISEEEKNIQIYIAVHKALFKLDIPLISFNLLKMKYSQWKDLPQSQLSEIAKNIYSIWGKIKKDLNHPLAEKFYQICERCDTSYLILGDIISGDPLKIGEKIKSPEVLESEVQAVYQKRLNTLKARLGRVALYVTLSIFITKVVIALAVEIPIDKYLTGQFSYFALGLNIFIPPFLMFLLVSTIRPPKRENLEQVIMEVMKITYQTERKDIYVIKPKIKRGLALRAALFIFYSLSFLISFGIIFLVLEKLEFGIFSISIFFLFVCLISFAGIKIRERSKELQVIEEKEGFFSFILDLFSLPFIRMGKWLSEEWAKHNALVILFNSLIDMPFQVFVEFLEQWRYFLKEKKEEIH